MSDYNGFKGNWRNGFESSSDQIGETDVATGITLTMCDVRMEPCGDNKKMRPVVYFEETDRKWVTCMTTNLCVEALYGADPFGWVNKPITLHWDPSVKFGKETVGGVRVTGAPGLERTVKAKISLPRKKPFYVELINTGDIAPTGPDALAEFLADLEITEPDVDAWLAAMHPKATPLARATPSQRNDCLGWLDSGASNQLVAWLAERDGGNDA